MLAFDEFSKRLDVHLHPHVATLGDLISHTCHDGVRLHFHPPTHPPTHSNNTKKITHNIDRTIH